MSIQNRIEVHPVSRVLFLCTGNSARSILAEALLNTMGQGRYLAFSAGSHPKAAPHPVALETLRDLGYVISEFRSKSWDEFAVVGASAMDMIVTVCDNAAGEVCPVWPGQPTTEHWSLEDPAALRGTASEIRACFLATHDELVERIAAFIVTTTNSSTP